MYKADCCCWTGTQTTDDDFSRTSFVRRIQGQKKPTRPKMNAKIFALFVLVLVECIYASSIPEENMIGLHEVT